VSEPLQLYRDEYSTYFRDRELNSVEQRWSAATKSMSEEQFRAGIERLADLLERERVPNVLIDMVNIVHEPAADFSDWRETNIIPRYNAAGVKKFAFLLPPSAGNTVEKGGGPAKEGSARFETGYFDSLDGVRKWFTTST
jgi:hypothetical protein